MNKLTDVQYDLIKEALDLDSWKHSWHLNVFAIDDINVNKKVIEIINDKINKRNQELEFLNEIKLLVENIETSEYYDVNDNIDDSTDDLPF